MNKTAILAALLIAACGNEPTLTAPKDSEPGICHVTGVDSNPYVFRPCDNDPEVDGNCITRLFLDEFQSPVEDLTTCRQCTALNGFSFDDIEEACAEYDLED